MYFKKGCGQGHSQEGGEWSKFQQQKIQNFNNKKLFKISTTKNLQISKENIMTHSEV